MVQYPEKVPIRELKFERADFWVQVHNLPLRFMNCEVAKEICGIIKKVCNSTDDADCDGGGLICARATSDVTSPLCKGRVITMKDGQWF